MAISEHFDDNELAAFFDTEAQKQSDAKQIEYEQNIVTARLWEAIKGLDLGLVISEDPSDHEKDFTALLKEVTELLNDLPNQAATAQARAEDANAIANQIWDEQVMMMEQISLALDMQLHGTISSAEKALMKKKLMARIIVKGGSQDQWLQLADAVLDGDPLDTNNPEDIAFMTEALEIVANLDNSPEVRLYDKLLVALGAPDLSQNLPDDYDVDELELLTYAARDIMEAALCHAQPYQQPDRHSKIHELVATYCLTDEVDLQVLLNLADTYAELKISQQ